MSEKYGGLGLTELDWVLPAEEAGYAALPHPFVETVGIAGPLLARTGDPPGLLPGLVTGEVVIAAQFDGTPLVPFGQSADAFVLRRDDALHVVRREDVECEPMDSIDGSRGVALVTWDPAHNVSLVRDDISEVDHWFDRGALGAPLSSSGSAGGCST